MLDILGKLFATELVLLIVWLVAATVAEDWQHRVWHRRILYILCGIISGLVLTIIAYIWV